MFGFIKSLGLIAMLLVSPWLWAAPVDINSATADELAKVLTGVGPAKAQAIVQYREKNGPFKAADDLTHVKGIGKATLEKNRANITVTGAAAPAPAEAVPAVAPKAPAVPPIPAPVTKPSPAPAPVAPH